MKKQVEIGAVYNLNLVLEALPDDYFLVRCEGCGLTRPVWRYNIFRGKGCRRCTQRNLDAPPSRRPDGRINKEHLAWRNMIERVTQPYQHLKERYVGSRYSELDVQSEWLGPEGFAVFYADVGPAPSDKHVLDRENNERGYIRGNVRWATAQQSNANKSNNRMLTVAGLTKSLAEWADDLGITDVAVKQRIDVLGWSVEDAVTLPSEGRRPTNDHYYMRIAGRVAKRGTCARRMVGCVLVDERYRVVATAYNSVPTGLPNCTSKPCAGSTGLSGKDLDACIAKHAEELALIKCHDVWQIFTCYVTTSPCIHCVRRLLDTSCERIVFAEPYAHNEEARAIWLAAGREWSILENDE